MENMACFFMIFSKNRKFSLLTIRAEGFILPNGMEEGFSMRAEVSRIDRIF
jgi:hypothetical protein